MHEPILVQDYLTRSARRVPEKVALVCGEERWTYAMLDRQSDRIAHWLCARGLARGERVAIFLDSSAESVIAVYAVLKAGGVFVSVNATAKEAKLAFQIEDSGARFLLTHAEKAPAVEAACAQHDLEIQALWAGEPDRLPASLAARSTPWSESLQTPLSEALPRGVDCDLAALLYTSGSTGEPKGVMATHRNMVSASRSIVEYLGNTESDVVLDVLPLSFGYGLYQVLAAFVCGATVVIEKSFVFMHPIMERIASEGVTGFPMVPTVAAMVLRLRNAAKYDLSSLRYVTNAGAGLPVEHLLALRRLLPERCRIFPMYGLTECTRVCYLEPELLEERLGSVGKAMPNCEVRLVGEDGAEAAVGEIGELTVRGANVAQGYWNAPEATARTFRAGAYNDDRWLFSGDLFRRDAEGYLYFMGRKDDLIKSGGEKVGPLEVENAICAIAGVAEAAVVGVPDEVLGQAVKAFVVRDETQSATIKEIMKHCAASLEAHMVPKHVEFLDALPKTPNGKVNKIALRAKQ